MRAYVIGRHVFVRHPLIRGCWIRTDLSVVKTACPYDGCGSAIGIPCRGWKGYAATNFTGSTHYERRRLARGLAIPAGLGLVIQ